MKVLVVGSGGREHAICRAVAKSPRVDKIYCAPGNAGIGQLAECVDIAAMEFDKLVAFAKENGCSTIVLEYLDTKGKKNKLGKMKQKISLWRHRDINKKVERFAHRDGMHYSRVCAINTSKLAFDGSGFVFRGHKVSNTTPYDICKFQNDKIYNCDLNASYNIFSGLISL